MVRKTNFLSISVLVSEISLLCLKRTVLYEFLQKCFKTTERHSLAVCGLLCGEKQFLLIFIRFYWFDQKHLLKQIQIFLRIWPFSNMVRKTNFLSISVLVSEIITFMSKKKSSLWISPAKYFKTTERLSLAICGLLCGEKQFLLIFIRFDWFDQKNLLKQIQIFLRICPFSNMVRKTNFLSFSVLVSEIVTFMSKKKSSLWISPKLLQNNRKA